MPPPAQRRTNVTDAGKPARIWVDVEDLFLYAAFNGRPSGIQRVAFELCRALATMEATRDRVGFLRHDPASNGLRIIGFDALDAVHRRLAAAPAASAGPVVTSAARAPDDAAAANPLLSAAGTLQRGWGGRLRRIAYRLPPDVRLPLVGLAKAQREGAGALAALGRIGGVAMAARGRSAFRRLAARRRSQAGGEQEATEAAFQPFGTQARPGDVLLVLGSTWFHPTYDELLARARERHGLRVALLVYDLIPVLRPEWCDENLVRRFSRWAASVLPSTDQLLTISQATSRDLVGHAARSGLRLRGEPAAIPMGTGFSQLHGADGAGENGGERRAEAPARLLPSPGSYVLVVSTVEARKNHMLLFRVWRRLLEEMPREQVPTLVFAGKVGWLVADLMQQLRNANFLDGHVVLVENLEDAELAGLYEGCLFTAFPSFYEGWGLPVTESLGFGRPAIVSNASSIPEAGGSLAEYFDPEDGNEAYRVIRAAIEDRQGLAEWTARVRHEFRRVEWTESARAMMEILDRGGR